MAIHFTTSFLVPFFFVSLCWMGWAVRGIFFPQRLCIRKQKTTNTWKEEEWWKNLTKNPLLVFVFPRYFRVLFLGEGFVLCYLSILFNVNNSAFSVNIYNILLFVAYANARAKESKWPFKILSLMLVCCWFVHSHSCIVVAVVYFASILLLLLRFHYLSVKSIVRGINGLYLNTHIII